MSRISITGKNLQLYIDKFMEGKTDNAEEQAIYTFFRTQRIPKKLIAYREMFAYFEEGMPEERLPIPTKTSKRPLMQSIQKHYRLLLATAACIALLFGMIGWKQYQEQKLFISKYEGSYMIVNGQRITDLNELKPDILSTLSDAEQLEKRSQNFLQQKYEEEQQTATELIQSINNPDMRRQLKAILYSDN